MKGERRKERAQNCQIRLDFFVSSFVSCYFLLPSLTKVCLLGRYAFICLLDFSFQVKIANGPDDRLVLDDCSFGIKGTFSFCFVSLSFSRHP